MSDKKSEVDTFFGRCSCCLAYGYLKNMWIEHQFDGEAEVYGEMIVQCFGLTWEASEDSMEQDHICEQCIFRLRDANDFKKVVQSSQEELLQLQEIDNDIIIHIKDERLGEKFLEEYKPESGADTADTSYTDTEHLLDTMTSVKDEMDYEEIEFLVDEDTADINDTVDTDSSQQTDQSKQVRSRRRYSRHPDLHVVEVPKRRLPKKLTKSGRQKTGKQYSEVDVRKCLGEVRSNVLTAGEASAKYNVPQKTTFVKIREKPYEFITAIKEERLDEIFLEKNKPESGADTADTSYTDAEHLLDTADTMTSVKDEEYEEVEFLVDEDAAEVNDIVDTDSSQQTDQSKQVRSRRRHSRHPDLHVVEAPKRRLPKKLTKSGRQKTCKQYSEVDVRKCLEEVRSNVLTAGEASAKYNVPQKTISAKIKAKPNEIITDIKEERLDEKFFEKNKPESGADTADTSYTDAEHLLDTADTTTSVKDEEYEEVEFLLDEDAAEVNDAVDTDSSQQTDQSKQVKTRRKQPRRSGPDDEEVPKRKWPKKLPKSERLKTYRQYSEDDLRNCLKEVRNNILTASEASAKYNIPRKTICAKIRAKPNGDEEVDENREKMFQLIKEIKTILTFTNATPYKSKNIRYYCAYCSTDGPHFEDPDDLRTHTRTEHVGHRTEKIEYAMRPYWMNEVIKLDIENLLCTVCCVVINNWNEMFKHLKDKHNVVLEQAYTRAIPYVLKSNLECALCKEPFSNYLHLDGHMNAHYNNYVCGDCGDTFLAHTRLKQHALKHNTGKFSCSICDKVFTLLKYKRKHEESVHEQRAKFKCQYCPEKFAGEYLRHLHCLAAHPETVKTITCEFCGDCFTWKQYYTAHIKQKHMNTKPYECSKCNKKFPGNNKLQEHMLRHVGAKNFECPICHKKYVSMNCLKQHGKQHKKKGEA